MLTIDPIPEILRIGLPGGRGESISKLLTSIAKVRIQGDKESIERPDNIIWSEDEYGDKEWVCKYFGVTESDIIKNRLNAIEPFANRSFL